MRLDRAHMSWEPQTVGSCLDLAFLLIGRYLPAFLAVWAVFAVPAGALIYGMAQVSSGGFYWTIIIMALVSIPLGVCLVVLALHVAFGEPVRLSNILWEGLVRQAVVTWPMCLVGRPLQLLGALFCLFPGWVLVIALGFLAESRLLRTARLQSHDHRTSELVQQEFGNLLLRNTALWALGCLLWVTVLITCDCAAIVLAGVSPVFGRIAEAMHNPWQRPEFEEFFTDFWDVSTTDPVVLCTMAITALLVYAVCRLAWFFTYLDFRIRRDCWDLEVALAEEAQQLEHRHERSG